ncbi:MAG: hypothetical protein ISS25_00225 [Nanoarchaeota archaeon]|nr:hypothetical protein [DPANN group archaeon]MBL7116245.1 hypothetical protein [Nanoarchaeota archaeon]
MDYQKLGFIIIAISIFLSFLVVSFIVQINKSHEAMCVLPNNMMDQVFQSYIGVSVIIILFVVGFFLVLNEKKEHEKKVEEKQLDKYETLLGYLTDDEKKIVLSVKEQPGITQATLKLRAGFSKSKLSALLIDLEKRNVLVRELKGRTYKVFLK